MQLRARVLGEFECQDVEPRRLGSRKARILLKVLALARGRPVAVDALVDRLWPGPPPARPEEQVGVLVSRLRAVLGADRLPRSDAGYALLLDWLDLDALEAFAAEASRLLTAGDAGGARAAAGAGLALARGPLLADEPDATWAAAERAAAERLVTGLHHVAARAALEGGDARAAADLAAIALAADPYDEAALRLLMRAHAAAGRPAAAFAVFARARDRLDEDLGVDPAPATAALHLAILQNGPLPSDDAPALVEAARRPAPPQLPGRAGQLAALDAALRRVAAAGPLEVIVVEGEAGIGKTCLLDVWSRRAAAAGATILAGQGDEVQQNLPLRPLLEALDGRLRRMGAPAAVSALLGPEHATLAPLLPASPPAERSVALDPLTGQTALFTALLAVIGRLAGRAPVVLLLDDLHLADGATVAWLHFAARHGGTTGVLVVGAVRPEEAPALAVGGRLPLEPLDLAAAAEVVRQERAAVLHARSGGHPMFLVELAAAGREGSGEEHGGRGGDSGPLPASLREAITTRCERAGPSRAATLRTAALLGPAVDLDLLAAVARRPPLEVLDHLEDGARRRLLELRGDSFVFRHELVREALAAGAGAARRPLVHREAARLLAARPERDPLVVAHHARLGGDRELAAGALTEAADRARGRFDHAVAERLLDDAIALADSVARRLQRARLRTLRGAWAEAEADALAALEAGGGADALETAGWAAYYRRDLPATRRYADDGARLGTGAVRARCLALAGRVRHVEGDLAGAEDRLHAAIDLTDEPPERVALAAWLGELRTHQGRALEALALAEPAIRAPAAPGLLRAVMHAHMTACHALGTLGRPAAALAAVDAWQRESERRRVGYYRAAILNFRAWVLRALGETAPADDLGRQALEAGRAIGRDEPQAHSLLDLADGRLQAGDLDAAEAHLEAALPAQRDPHSHRWRHVLRARFLRGRLVLARGEAAGARVMAARLEQEAAAAGARRYADLAFLLGVRAAAALGEPLDVRATARVLEGLGDRAGLEAWWVAGEVAAATATDAFWALAEAYAARLADEAGPSAEGFRRYAGARLERMRTAGRQG